MLSRDQPVDSSIRFWISGTYQRGSTLTGFEVSSSLIVISYHWGGRESGDSLGGWFKRRRHESACLVRGKGVQFMALVRINPTLFKEPGNRGRLLRESEQIWG
jgi:hypothetical protein